MEILTYTQECEGLGWNPGPVAPSLGDFGKVSEPARALLSLSVQWG